MSRLPIHILCATDDAYVPYYGIMLTSLFENNRNECFSVHILTSGLREDSITLLKKVTARYQHTISFVSINASDFSDCPIRPGDHVTMATYYRLMAASVLPEAIDKILWLDGDLIVNGSITSLWETDLTHFAVAAVTDESFVKPEIYQRLQLNPEVPYTSAGVLLINLDYWRKHDVTNRFMECIRQQQDRLLFHDQDTLNIVLQHEKIVLPLTWNYQTGFFTSWSFPVFPVPFQQEILHTADNPRIIHYSGPSKPWFKNNIHPYRSFYDNYKALSPWMNLPMKSFGLKQDTLNWIGKVSRTLKLRPSPYILKDQKP